MNESNRISEYLKKQKEFFNVRDIPTAKYERIHLGINYSEEEWEKLAFKTTDLILKNISVKNDWTILDLGCGTGRIMNEMCKRYPNVHLIGTDISESMINFAKEALPKDNRIELHIGTGYDLSVLHNKSVDFAYSVDVLIHMFDIDIILNYLNEIYRVLKDSSVFRFNVRSFIPETAFSNSIGGLIAKIAYKTGLISCGFHQWKPGEDAEFNGNQFTDKDLKKMLNKTRFKTLDIKLSKDNDFYWITLEKPKL